MLSDVAAATTSAGADVRSLYGAGEIAYRGRQIASIVADAVARGSNDACGSGKGCQWAAAVWVWQHHGDFLVLLGRDSELSMTTFTPGTFADERGMTLAEALQYPGVGLQRAAQSALHPIDYCSEFFLRPFAN